MIESKSIDEIKQLLDEYDEIRQKMAKIISKREYYFYDDEYEEIYNIYFNDDNNITIDYRVGIPNDGYEWGSYTCPVEWLYMTDEDMMNAYYLCEEQEKKRKEELKRQQEEQDRIKAEENERAEYERLKAKFEDK